MGGGLHGYLFGVLGREACAASGAVGGCDGDGVALGRRGPERRRRRDEGSNSIPHLRTMRTTMLACKHLSYNVQARAARTRKVP